MATHRCLFSLSIVLGLLVISTTARPCKTLFFFATTTAYFPINPNYAPTTTITVENPNSNLETSSDGPRSLTLFITEFRQRRPRSSMFLPSYNPFAVTRTGADAAPDVKKQAIALEFYASVRDSIRDRTKDIMSVVGALLFGVGCGALTAATMYLIWSLFPASWFRDSEDEFEDADDEDIASLKKMGYVAVPAVNDVKPPSAKEVV